MELQLMLRASTNALVFSRGSYPLLCSDAVPLYKTGCLFIYFNFRLPPGLSKPAKQSMPIVYRELFFVSCDTYDFCTGQKAKA